MQLQKFITMHLKAGEVIRLGAALGLPDLTLLRCQAQNLPRLYIFTAVLQQHLNWISTSENIRCGTGLIFPNIIFNGCLVSMRSSYIVVL
jgi:hypothetical protein